jgi:hypothetical protein
MFVQRIFTKYFPRLFRQLRLLLSRRLYQCHPMMKSRSKTRRRKGDGRKRERTRLSKWVWERAYCKRGEGGTPCRGIQTKIEIQWTDDSRNRRQNRLRRGHFEKVSVGEITVRYLKYFFDAVFKEWLKDIITPNIVECDTIEAAVHISSEFEGTELEVWAFIKRVRLQLCAWWDGIGWRISVSPIWHYL